ncbi:putative S-acyltransferase [Platanthera guangdongensis]|uniref:S-acyltransferase n=1 Tax=Platanthera guangdongensis TaxID=2320717 RepID=A0ABR2LV47_9ASPA
METELRCFPNRRENDVHPERIPLECIKLDTQCQNAVSIVGFVTNVWMVLTIIAGSLSFLYIGLGLAAYSSVLSGNCCADFMFPSKEAVLGGHSFKVSSTFLAMLSTLPLAQLFFFHVLLIKKGISTYDYIIALREQEQQGNSAQQSPQLSPMSSVTGLSSTSSINTFRRAAWCTPPRLFLEDQVLYLQVQMMWYFSRASRLCFIEEASNHAFFFLWDQWPPLHMTTGRARSLHITTFDVVVQETSIPTYFTGKKVSVEDSRRKNPTVKINPWTLARLKTEDVSKAAAEARKRSRISKPIAVRDVPSGVETDCSFGSDSGQFAPRIESWTQPNKRDRLRSNLPFECVTNASSKATKSGGALLTPLQLEARSAFTTSKAMSTSRTAAFSPDSSLGSPDIRPFHVSSLAAEDTHELRLRPPSGAHGYSGIQLSRSTSDGYDASGGEDSDQIPSGIIPRSVNWSSLLISSDRSSMENENKVSSS